MMRKLLSFMVLLAGASLFAIAGPEKPRNHVGPPVWEEPHRGYSLSSGAGVGGIWVSPKSVNGPYGALYTNIRDNVSVLGFSKNGKAEPHDFAIVAEKDGIRFQIVDEKGVPHSIPATALLKLAEPEKKVSADECLILGDAMAKELEAAGLGKRTVNGFVFVNKETEAKIAAWVKRDLSQGPTFGVFRTVSDKPSSDSPVPPKPAVSADEIPAGHKLLYRIARDRAVAEYARTKGVSRAAAREKVDAIDDTTIHAAVQAASVSVKAVPVGGKLTDFLDWLSTHGDQIMAIVKIIMSLLSLFAHAATELGFPLPA